MAYKISLTRLAEADAYSAYETIRNEAPDSAALWLTGLFKAIANLTEHPDRCPIIPEAAELEHQARHLIYGKRTGAYRIIYDIQEASDEGSRIRVLRIWHGYRDAIKPEDIDATLV
jgi:plasmid stabilization system protein ParE